VTDAHTERKTLQFETLLRRLRDADISGDSEEAAWLYTEIGVRLGRLEGIAMGTGPIKTGSYQQALAILNGTRP
jgi:hypothetical protein